MKLIEEVQSRVRLSKTKEAGSLIFRELHAHGGSYCADSSYSDPKLWLSGVLLILEYWKERIPNQCVVELLLLPLVFILKFEGGASVSSSWFHLQSTTTFDIQF